MDINMPVLNGTDATRQFRAAEKDNEHMPIIALTANVIQDDVNSYYEAGMDDYMPKPFSLVKLREMLQKWVTQTSSKNIKENTVEPVSDLPDIDVDLVQNLQQLMGDAYDDLVETFVERSAILVVEMANNKNNMDKLIREVHSLKGSSGTMGATKLSSICAEFESSLTQGKEVDLDNMIKNISREIALVKQYFMN
jgi:HPt (histidine-containing phosphotransfer) domain-containing protein